MAGALPRVDEVTLKGAASLPQAAKKGGVAVVWDGATAILVEGCHLPSRYLDLEDAWHRGVYSPNERVLYRPDEIPEECETATHAVGAFARWDEHLSAILVPLPCPSVATTEPARGCIAAGKTGAQRARLAKTRPGPPFSATDPAPVLETWALAPDTLLGFQALMGIPDPAFWDQRSWIFDSYDISGNKEGAVSSPLPRKPNLKSAPSLHWDGPAIMGYPAFGSCFWPHVDARYPRFVDPGR